jgi:hypothetical protein
MYRLPEVSGVRTQHINIGGQIAISGELNPPQVEAIIRQHAPYGLKAVDEIDRTKAFTGLCYSLDRQINVEKLMKAIAHNMEVLTTRGAEQRMEAAVAINNALEDQQQGGNLKALQVSVMEENQDKHDGPGPIVSEGFEVSRSAEPTPAKKAGRR